MSDDKKIVYFVKEGRMHSSWIIGHMDINVAVEPSEEYTKPIEVATNIVTTDRCENLSQHSEAKKAVLSNTKLGDLIERPGRWFYLSGMQVVHGDDLYSTREQAAEAYKNYLMEEH